MKATSNLINQLNKYALDNNNMQQFMMHQYYQEKAKIYNKIQQKKENETKKNKDFFIPDEKDSIFWCWFIFNYGFSEYEILREKNFIIEKEYKIKFIEKVRKRKKFLKHMKVKVNEMEGHLANDPKLNITYLEPMLAIDKFNFIFMNDKIYYENLITPENKTCINHAWH